ncbi:MAG: hypothetical protein ACAI25_09635 [Planctomycetota bacterium]
MVDGGLTFSSDGSRLYSVNGSLRGWDVHTGASVGPVSLSTPQWPSFAHVDPRHSLCAIREDEGWIRVVDLQGEELAKIDTGVRKPPASIEVDFLPGGQVVVLVALSGDLACFEPRTGALVWRAPRWRSDSLSRPHPPAPRSP